MSIWGFLVVLFAVIQFIIENYKKHKKTVVTPANKIIRLVKFDKILRDKNFLDSGQIINKEKVIRGSLRDREDEIFEKSTQQGDIVTEFIFSEILSKPKYKR